MWSQSLHGANPSGIANNAGLQTDTGARNVTPPAEPLENENARRLELFNTPGGTFRWRAPRVAGLRTTGTWPISHSTYYIWIYSPLKPSNSVHDVLPRPDFLSETSPRGTYSFRVLAGLRLPYRHLHLRLRWYNSICAVGIYLVEGHHLAPHLRLLISTSPRTHFYVSAARMILQFQAFLLLLPSSETC